MSLTHSSGGTYLAVDAIKVALLELGYEDLHELEDALKSTVEEFLSSLPHVELLEVDGKKVIRSKPENSLKAKEIQPGSPQKLVFQVSKREDLQVTCLKTPEATIQIPELEFEIGADEHRVIDTIWNHISKAIFNLSVHISIESPEMNNERRESIQETIDALSGCLDVDTPFTWVVLDPTGKCEIHPDTNVHTLPL
uniref:Zinc finger ZPR1-type domain-containing protein n=1 Tax=Arcella intermedia TaxID=1963864 RepID=A0A6B2LHF4_9EUKA